MHFEDLSNELILCIWDQLLEVDVIFSFCNLNNRITSLLHEFYGLYTKLNLRYSSLSVCRYFCRQVPNMIEWRLGLTVLKLGNRYRCCQLEMFTNEIAKSFMLREEEQYNVSNDFRLLMTSNKHLQPIFPHLVSLVVFQSTCISDNCRDILLYSVAGGSAMRTFTWRSCGMQTCNSKAFFDWLFRCSRNLNSYQLITHISQTGFELTYEHTLINGYTHHSLISLQINVVNFLTLNILLHYLPQLQHLDVHINNKISSTDNIDHLLTTLNYPKELRTLKLSVKIVRQALNLVKQLVEKFINTLEVLSLFTVHLCNGDINLCFDGHRLSILCGKLSQLRKLSFVVDVYLIEKPNNDLISRFTKTFCTPFWLNGPLDRIQVCVDSNSLFNVIRMLSLPYIFSNHVMFHTNDLINIQFNTNENKRQTPMNLSVALEPLWYNMRRLLLQFAEKQQISLTLLCALQCRSRFHDKILMLSHERGILPSNAEKYVQLVHFTYLQLQNPSNSSVNYDIQNILSWLRLLPNIVCLNLQLTELKHWFMNDHGNTYFDFFLQRLNRLFVECPCIINKKINDEIMKPLLLFIINKHRFPQLRCLRFSGLENILSSWDNIDQWIDFILNRITEHQLTCVRFDFTEKIKEKEITNLQTGDEVITITEPPYVVDVHRFIWANHVILWMEQRQN